MKGRDNMVLCLRMSPKMIFEEVTHQVFSGYLLCVRYCFLNGGEEK